jgi:hypothetical protein
MIYYVVQPGNLGEQYYCGERRLRRGVFWSYYQADAKAFLTYGEAATKASDLIQRGYKNVLISRSDRKREPPKEP